MGFPLPELSLAWWRNQIAVVSQDVYLFNASVAENIAYGKLEATREETRRGGPQSTCAESLLRNCPMVSKRFLGTRAVRLSGGQRQRLALARAFIRRSQQILILG